MFIRIINSTTIIFLFFLISSCGNFRLSPDPTIETNLQMEISETTEIPSLPSTTSSQPNIDYLGQKEPDKFPERFASDLIMGELHSSPVFMPDGTEVYWASQGSKVNSMKLENDQWTQPESISFSASMTDYRDPFISPSGDKLFFLSKGKIPNSQLPEKENIWFVEREKDGWGEPHQVGELVNALIIHWQISVSANGNLYFSAGRSGVEDIYFSRFVAGEYKKPERLVSQVNTDQFEFTPFIAQDESYLIFTRMADQNSNPRLYISYRNQIGGWGEPVLIEKIPYGLCPIVSPEGKYLFFLSSPQTVSWMRTDLLPPPVGIADKTIQLEEVINLDLQHSFINTIVFSPNDRFMITADMNGEVLLWERGTWEKTILLPARSDRAADIAANISYWGTLALSPNGETIVTAFGERGDVSGLDLEGREQFSFSYGARVYSVAISPDGRFLAVGGLKNNIVIFDLITQQPVADLSSDQGNIIGLVFSPDGKKLLAYYRQPETDSIFKIWETNTWQVIDSFKLPPDPGNGYHDFLFSPGGDELVIAGTEIVEIKLLNLATREIVKEFPEHSRSSYQIVFSPDGSLLASAGDDGTIRFWDMASGININLIEVRNRELGAVDFSPDGSLIAFSVLGEGVQVWSVKH